MNRLNIKYRRYITIAIYFFFGVLAVASFFRFAIISEGDILPGHRGDGRLNVILTEHWLRVFSGLETWRSPNFFYPVKGVLGYSDAFFINGLVHSSFRKLGMDQFHAYLTTLITFAFAGYFGLCFLLRKFLKLPHFLCILGGILFVISNQAYMICISSHPQLLVFWLTPLMCVLFFSYMCNSNRLHIKGWISGGLFSVILPLICFSSFYTGWFFILISSVLLAVFFCFTYFDFSKRISITKFEMEGRLKIDLHRFFNETMKFLSAHRFQLFFFSFLLMCMFAPFFITYIPVKGEGRRFSEIIPMLPQLGDFINVGYHNLIWGDMLKAIFPDLNVRPYYWELWNGFPWLMLTIFSITLCFSVFRTDTETEQVNSNKKIENDKINYKKIINCLGITIVLFILLLIKVDKFSMWWMVFKFVPGGDAIRAVFRIALLLSLPVIIIVMIAMRNLWFRCAKIQNLTVKVFFQALFGLLCAILICEQFNKAPYGNLSRSHEIRVLNQFPPPPEDIQTFFFSDPINPKDPWEFHQIDAMLIAQKYNIPTIHGYSGLWPPDWPLTKRINDADYIFSVNSWLRANNLEKGVYSLNGRGKEWGEKHEFNDNVAAYSFGKTIEFSQKMNSEKYLSGGWHHCEQWGRWTAGEKSRLLLRLEEKPANDIVMTAEVTPFINEKHPVQKVLISVNDEDAGEYLFDIKKPATTLSVHIPHTWISSTNIIDIEITLPDACSPKELGLSDDARVLGLGFRTIKFTLKQP